MTACNDPLVAAMPVGGCRIDTTGAGDAATLVPARGANGYASRYNDASERTSLPQVRWRSLR